MRRLFGAAIGAGVVVVGLSCGGDGPVDTGPGELKVRLTAPATNADSAIVFTITGPAPLTSATVGTGLRLFQQPLGGTTTRFALTGSLAHGAFILTIGVPDVGAFSQYSGAVDGVAQANYQLRPLAGYALAVMR